MYNGHHLTNFTLTFLLILISRKLVKEEERIGLAKLTKYED